MNFNEELLKLGCARDGRECLERHSTKKWERRYPSDIQGMVFHQSLEERGSASGNAKYHVGSNHISEEGLPGLSYTGFVEKDGTLWLANDIEDVTFSQGTSKLPGDENYTYIAFCFGGNFSGPGYVGTQSPTKAQLKTADVLWEWAKRVFSFKNNQLFGHFDFGKPACPGYDLMQYIERIRAEKDWVGLDFNLNTIAGRQMALHDLGHYCGWIDGDWGPMSKKALCNFQKAAGLLPDGVWGPKTEAAVIAAFE